MESDMDIDEIRRKRMRLFGPELSHHSNGPAGPSSATRVTDGDEALARVLQEKYDAASDNTGTLTTNNHADDNMEESDREQKTHMTFSKPIIDNAMVGVVVDVSPPAIAIRQLLSVVECSDCAERLVNEQSVLEHFSNICNASQYEPCHCENGRLTSIFALLAGYDTYSRHNKPTEPKQKHAATSIGIGYGGDQGEEFDGEDFNEFDGEDFNDYEEDIGDLYGPGRRLGDGMPSDWQDTQPARTIADLKDEQDQLIATVMKSLCRLLPKITISSTFDQAPPAEVAALLLRSSILDRAAELLLSTSTDDVTTNLPLYDQLGRFVQTLAAHYATAPVVIGPRTINKGGHNVLKLAFSGCTRMQKDSEEEGLSIAYCMDAFSRMTKTHASSVKAIGMSDAMWLCSAMSEAHVAVKVAQAAVDPISEAPALDAVQHEDSILSSVLGLPDHTLLADFSFRNEAKDIRACSGNSRMKHIVGELTSLSGSLPPGIFVRHAESRPDCMKVLIRGPQDTPYANGLFEFDLLCPGDFPQKPPRMKFKTTGDGSFHFNPNLYADGKVCLSLLGTWSGQPWQPGKSTLLQLLVSIQAMIFCENPWCNEPGQEGEAHSEASKVYNCSRHPKTVELAMLGWLQGKGSGIWGDVVRKHFEEKEEEILRVVETWKADKAPEEKKKEDKGKANEESIPLPSGFFVGGQTLGGENALSQFLSSALASSLAAVEPSGPVGTGFSGRTLGDGNAEEDETSSGHATSSLVAKLRAAVVELARLDRIGHGHGGAVSM